jgi:hypothetical protein
LAFLWFGKGTKLDDFKPKDLEQESLVQQVLYDQLLSRQRRAIDEHDGLLHAASGPGVTNPEQELAAYKMLRATKRRVDAEGEMQRAITRMDVLDSTIDLIRRKKELEKRGIWGRLNDLDPDDLQTQLEHIAVERKKGEMNLDRISEVLNVAQIDVESKRSAGFRRELDAIKGMAWEANQRHERHHLRDS